MANVYESKFKGVEVDKGVNIALNLTGTGVIQITTSGTGIDTIKTVKITPIQSTGTSTTDVMSQNAVTEALKGKQDTITDQLKVTGTTHFYQKTGWSGAPLLISSNNGDFIEAYKGSSITQIDMLDGNYSNTIYLPTGDGTIALTSNTVSSIGGQTGVIALSTGLAIGSNGLYCTVAGGGGSAGVSSIGGKTGVITLGTGLSISNTNVLSCTVTGVTSIGGRTGDVGLGRGIALGDTGEIENFTWEVTYQVEDLPSDLQEPEVYVSIITNLPRETLDQFTNSITFAQLKENFGPDNSSSDDGVFILNPYGYALVGRESGSGRTAVKPLLFNETNGVVFPSLQSDSGFIYSGTNSIHFTRASIRRV